MSGMISQSEVRMEHKKRAFKNEKERARAILEALEGMDTHEVYELK